MNFKKAAVIFSFAFPIITSILIINFLTGIIAMPWQGMPVLCPLLFSPIGIMLALASIKTSKRWAIWGIILNSALFLFPFFWFIGGTLLSGV
ncbi:hypothetical protein [Bacillus mojavensis]|uniref:hypothetical protein n=1 Tax=Bacillus mojavensis TaxID=72360 RepID=UPI002DBAA405|nr:hypothetical protein [Bacillus mojavensis]